MTRDEILGLIDDELNASMYSSWHQGAKALRAVMELHYPINGMCNLCIGGNCTCCTGFYSESYPCPTIQAIEKELND